MNETARYIKQNSNILSIYFTADYPHKGVTKDIIHFLTEAGVDLIEVGLPFSDPLADGPIIQHSSYQAIKNGFKIDSLFEDLHQIKPHTKVPLVLMCYLNNILAYGVEKFLQNLNKCNIDTIIVPDLPVEIYENTYKKVFSDYSISPVFFITPQSSNERIKLIDEISNSFIYAVSDNTITGKNINFTDAQLSYFQRIKNLNLNHPVLIGFGIKNRENFKLACKYANGAIIGSAFIEVLKNSKDLKQDIFQFVKNIK